MRDDTPCKAVAGQLAGYAAGELDAREVAEVERHLATCAGCRGELATERSLRETLAALPVVPCPERVTEAVLAAVDASETRHVTGRRRAVPFGRWQAAGGMAAAAAMVVLLLAAPWQDRPAATDPAAGGSWSEREIAAARGELRLTLALTARIIGETERRTVNEVFGQRVPGAVNRSMKTLTTYLEGGRG
jgi:anti-sigma factor RsiW